MCQCTAVVTTVVTNHVDTDLEDFFVGDHNVDNDRHSSFSGDRLHPGLGRGDGWQPGRAEDQDAEYGRGEDGDHLEGGDHLEQLGQLGHLECLDHRNIL